MSLLDRALNAAVQVLHPDDDPSENRPMRDRRMAPRDWSISNVPERQCTAHKRNGDRCKNAAIRGGAVCGWHEAHSAVKAKARLRLEMASDRLARQLLNMTSDPNVADPVKLAAIKDALDRGGIQAKTAVLVEVSTKPYELVFDSISAGPRSPRRLGGTGIPNRRQKRRRLRDRG